MSRRYPPPPRQKPASAVGWVWFVTGTLAGVCIALLLYVYGLLPAPRPSAEAGVTPPSPAAEVVKPAPAAPPAPPPEPVATRSQSHDFEFYDMLPNSRIRLPEYSDELAPEDFPPALGDDIVLAAPTDFGPLPPATLPPPGSFMLQVASFRSRRDAESLKNRVSQLGVAVSLQTAEVGGNQWFRVRVGPFASEAEASQVATHLLQNNLDAMLLKF